MKYIQHDRSATAKAWIKAESAAQHERYVKISTYINETLAPQRTKWIKGFLERIQTRGYSVHFDQMRKIAPDELPKEPRRKHRFVY